MTTRGYVQWPGISMLHHVTFVELVKMAKLHGQLRVEILWDTVQ